jgi:hypothetical protein
MPEAEPPLNAKPPMNQWLALAIVIAVAAAVCWYVEWRSQPPPPPPVKLPYDPVK